MKSKPDPTEDSNAIREATLKVAKLRRIVEAEEKLAQAAKVRFKGAKKTWKHARKTAKRSAKKLKHAENHLAALAKQSKRTPLKPKTKRRTRPTPTKLAAIKITKKVANPVRRKARRTTAATRTVIAPPPDATITAAADITPPLPNSEPAQD